MGSGIISVYSRRTHECVKSLFYRDRTRRREIIDNWNKQYGENKIYLQINPFANEKMIDRRGINVCRIKEIQKSKDEIVKPKRPKAEYSNRTPFSILDEFTKPSQ